MKLAELSEYLSHAFVRNALVVGVLIALCSSLLGVTLVLKRLSFIGDGLSRVAFGAMTVAAVVGLTNEMLLVLPITIVCAVLLLMSTGRKKTSGDASVAVISVSALAIGYLLMNIFPPKSGNVTADVCTVLFGSTSILTLTKTEVALCIALSVVTVAAFCLFYNKIFCITFDESFAKTSGTRVEMYNLIIAVIIAVIIVLAMNLVGSLLISALIIFPALSAMRVCKSFKAVTVCSAVLSVICSLAGILIAVVAGTPVGSTIVAADIVIYLLFMLLGRLGAKRAG